MNVQLPDVYCIGQRLPMEGTLADIPIIYSEGGGSYNPSIPSFFGGGGGAPSSDSYDINFDPSEALLFSIGNNIKTKCLLESLNGVINSKYDFNRIISKFKVPQKTVFFTEGVNLIDDADATTKFISSNEVLITLNTRLKNYSKEYMALAIYHELLHAYMGTYKSEIWKNDEQHELMTGQNYLDIYLFEIGNLLKIRFPNASKDADKLIWAGGLTDTEYFKNHIKLDAKVEVEKTIRDYTNGNNGTYCKN